MKMKLITKRIISKRLTSILLSGALAVTAVSYPVKQSVYAADNSVQYVFDHTRTASKQLEDIFTTIDLMDATIGELESEMAEGNVTSEELTQMYIDRINKYDGKLNSVIWINPEALNDAQKLDCERAEGNVRGPLHGIPIIVKDNYNVKGMPTSAGCLALADMIAKEDSYTVKKLRDAGAVIIAKANMSEFAWSAVYSTSTLGGITHNPYDLKRSPAGSSGGTAVAVTANFAAAGLGTDTGGSIRNPSSYNNLYGIRPSKGLTSIEGVVPLCVDRDTTGPMARSAEDMALILETIAGTDEKDDYTVEAKADELLKEGYTKSLSADGLKGKRIAFLQSSFSYDERTWNWDWMPDPEDEQSIAEFMDWWPSYYFDDNGGNGDTGEGDGNGGAGENGEGGDTGESEPEATAEPSPTPFTYELSDKTRQIFNRARAVLRKAGAELVDLSDLLPDYKLIYPRFFAAVDSNTEYDINRFLQNMGDEAHYKTVKDILKTGKGIGYSKLDELFEQDQDVSDTSAIPDDPYTCDVNGFMRGRSWQYSLNIREKVAKILEENDIDAIIYAGFSDVAFDMNNEAEYEATNWSDYTYLFGPALGMPEISIPMGFADTAGNYNTEMPLGLAVVGNFGDEKTLMEIAYAYEQYAGKDIRRIPANTPALRDDNLNAYLEALMDEVYSIDYSLYNKKPEGKVQLMYNEYRKAAAVDKNDPYAVYDVAVSLARSYDKVVNALKESGLATPVPTKAAEPTAKPAEPTEPAKPTEPSKQTEPVKPTEQAKPTEPAQPTEPVKPTESAKSAESVKPTEPAKPAETANTGETSTQSNIIAPTSSPANIQLIPTDGQQGSNVTSLNTSDTQAQDKSTTVSELKTSKAKLKISSKTMRKGKTYKIRILNRNGQRLSYSVWDRKGSKKAKDKGISVTASGNSNGKIKVSKTAESGTYIIKVNVKKNNKYKAKVLKFTLRIA